MSSTQKERKCKVCLDAGKPESEYRSHYVKSEVGVKGKVICPTLLEMECTYCKTKGHMKSYCVILKKNVLSRKKECSRVAYSSRSSNASLNASSNASSKSNANAKSKSSNVFDSLCIGSDSEDSEEDDMEEDFPALCRASNSCSNKASNNASNKKASNNNASNNASMYATAVVGAGVSAKMGAVVGAAVGASKKLSWVEMDGLDSDDDDN